MRGRPAPRRNAPRLASTQVGVSVSAPGKTGGSAETVELLAKVLGVQKKDCSLSRGWGGRSKLLHVNPPFKGLDARAAFKLINDAIEAEPISFSAAGLSAHTGHSMGATSNLAGGDEAMHPSVGAASNIARKMWEAADQDDELAPAPTKKQQTFRA